jgi:hypothetical protein
MPMNIEKQPCRNCGGSDIYVREVDANGLHGPKLLPLGFFAFPKFRLRVCGHCGLADWFVPKEHLRGVKDRFDRE